MKIEREGSVLSIIFDRPEKKNALTRAMYMAATRALAQADQDEDIGAVLFSGAGGFFTAGNDIGDFLLAEAKGEPDDFPAFAFIRALAACETPLVAAIEGVAIGIGATLILHCDLVYAAPSAAFRMPFIDLGLVPEAAATLLLPRRVGMAKAAEFLLLGEPFDAQEALRLGLVNEMIAPKDLKDFALERARCLAHKPRAALVASRRLMRGDRREILERIDEEGRLFGLALQSREARAAFAAFVSRSKPP
ncbi:Enoyl-CoA hydratase/carnithine racemase [Methylocapsa palsarum]|uniref:Enoyl-CoA hydratase/carnithine racemase n=2 Tax=Methylocapsa palsarum TaxID=1612308 RepID=A0A1I3X3W8_9HYPH|nr:Enoyl-CoA hydratase/carnithine racemase [Methylocapsa palsarum]